MNFFSFKTWPFLAGFVYNLLYHNADGINQNGAGSVFRVCTMNQGDVHINIYNCSRFINNYIILNHAELNVTFYAQFATLLYNIIWLSNLLIMWYNEGKRRVIQMTEIEFQANYGTEDQCRQYLFEKRWPEGFICPKCGHKEYFNIESRNLFLPKV